MAETLAIVRRWGNSLGITLPTKMVKDERIKPNDKLVITLKKVVPLKDLFGMVKFKQSTQEIKNEIRKGWGE